MSATDLDLSELRARVILELKTVTGSDAYSQTLIDNKLNEAYQDVFNQPKKNVYLREGVVEFMSVPDTQVEGTLTAGDTTINVTSTANYLSAGVILVEDDLVTYTGKTATSFTGCSGVNITREDEPVVRPTYLLTTLTSDIDEQQIRAINLEGLPLEYAPYSSFISKFFEDPTKYSLINGRLILPRNLTAQAVAMEYFKLVGILTLDGDKPSLIPNSFRQMLVYYAVGLILILDDERTGWDKYYNYNANRPERSSGLYFEKLRMFYAKYSRRVDQIRKRAGSIWD